jgi:hypothetical protein
MADISGIGRVVFETDCINVKNVLSSNEYDLGRWASSL